VARLASTTAVLKATGCRPGKIYGRLTDVQTYTAMLDARCDLFTNLAEELASALVDDRIDYVAGDAPEGFNPTHDVCRLVINAAVELVRRRGRRRLPGFDFLLEGPPAGCPEALRPRALMLRLDDEAFARKIRAARAYPELRDEVDSALREHREEAFRLECLRPVEYALDLQGLIGNPPFYESYGEKQVAAGRYDRVVRHRQHVVPIAAALRARLAVQG